MIVDNLEWASWDYDWVFVFLLTVIIIMTLSFVATLNIGAHMRRASAELENRRRASLGASRRADGTLDPHHAAILFRDSRGVSRSNYNNKRQTI